ncbi:MAG: WD40/YVTN/BNR-like repeat-containing protein, partial [Acidothermaceae bacterium]
TWSFAVMGANFWSITRAGSGFAALGHRGGPDQDGSEVVGTSVDGVTWRLVDASVPAQLVMPLGEGYQIASGSIGDHAIDVAVPDVVASSAGDDALRSVDGGRTWAKLGLDLTGIDVLPGGSTMYATGNAGKPSCVGAVYRSTDAGGHWTLLPSSCQNRPLYAVAFVDSDHGFAAGGTPTKYDGSDVVEATDDGGRTWHVQWSTPYEPDGDGGGGGGFDNEMVRLAFADTRHGYALTGGCVDGQNGPCGGGLYVTADAGRSWQRAGRTGRALAATTTGTVYLSGDARDGDAAVAVSTDAGRDWTSHGTPEALSSQPVSGTGSDLWWQTSLGTFTSKDAGGHWARATAAALGSLPPDAGPLQAMPPHDLLAASDDAVWSSTDDGRTSRETTPGAVTDGVEAVALGAGGQAAALVGTFDDCSTPELVAKLKLAKPGLRPSTRPATLYLSRDAGGHWRKVAALPFPTDAVASSSIAVDAGLIVVVDACGDLQRSTDSGSSWTTITPPNASVGCTVSLYDEEIWLQCLASLAHSADKGATWTTYTANGGGVQRLAQPLDAIAPESALVSAGGSLWRTTDGGMRWTQTWPSLDGES